MGNNPSTNTRSPSTSSPSSSSHDSSSSSSKPSSTRRDPRNLIHAQRAPAEPSLAQARGTTTTGSTTGHRAQQSRSLPQGHSHSQSQSHSQSHAPTAQLRYPSPSQSLNSPSQKNSDSQMGTQQSKEEPKVDMREQRSKPVDVPAPNSNIDSTSIRSYSQSIDPSGPPLTQDMSYHLTRPPRLPLPIEQEVHTPGSPIIAPTDVGAPLEEIESLDNDILPRRSSALSTTTLDEDDADELQVDKTGTTVPTTFEWKKGGDKVYVTGTIFQWNRKHRLQPVDGNPNLLRSVALVRPGTHHIRFIVDGVMSVSPDLPTTVDFGNNLVNYIEVSADDLPQPEPASKEKVEGAPTPSAQDQAQPTKKADSTNVEEGASTAKAAPKTKAVLPHGRYTSEIPQYLLDLDKAEDSAAYQYAAAAIEKLPTPPSLPGFLGKPILNAATPMKDDNSVLTMPNHTVLNHLATSSIKNNVLAVSVTTRYRKKYVTTIMYKPTGDD